MRRLIIGLVAGIVVVAVLGGIGFLVWTSNPYPPMPQALDALKSDSQVDVSTNPWFVFKPHANEARTGFIFYPGGLVDPRAYAPTARAIAAQGFLVVVPPMPFDLAFVDANRASDVIAQYPSIQHWAIGGHSLGGVAAAMFVKSHPDAVQGMVFWAAYPPDSMTDSRVATLSIYGTDDSSVDRLAGSRTLVPYLTALENVELMLQLK